MQYYSNSAPYYNINMIQGLDKVHPINSKYILTIHYGCAQNRKNTTKLCPKFWFGFSAIQFQFAEMKAKIFGFGFGFR